jgi:ubiquinone/menaquinone biosynthesis C-methylase UbiE
LTAVRGRRTAVKQGIQPESQPGIQTMNPIFYEIFNQLPRGGPGDRQSTKKAIKMIQDLPVRSKILDIGCGPGLQTLELARLTNGQITALDNHQPFLDRLKEAARREGVANNIECINRDMSALDFEQGYFDLIWCEGAIFILGFEKGLKEWQRYLKPNGALGLTEMTWLKDNPPSELRNFLKAECPKMTGIEGYQKIIAATGYHLTGQFVLPEAAWWEDYYHPLEQQLTVFREKYKGNEEAMALIESLQLEIDMYRQYADYYGYVFFVMRKKGE